MRDSQHLHQVHFFQGLDEDALMAVAQSSHERHIARDTFIFSQDEPATTFYLLMEGRARLSQVTLDGNQVILGFVVPGQVVGIIAAIQNAAYPLSLQAMTNCVACTWDHTTLLDLMERYPLLALRALRMVTGRFVQLQHQYRELATERVERRIARALLRLVEQAGQRESRGVRIDLPLSRQDLAEMTGTTLYTVSRTLSQWERQGWLESGRERVFIRSVQALVTIADDVPVQSSASESPSLPCPPDDVA